MNSLLAWFITFNFINIAWIFFRAKEFGDALKVLGGMFGFSGIINQTALETYLRTNHLSTKKLFITIGGDSYTLKFLIVGFIIILFFKNTQQLTAKLKFNTKELLAYTFITAVAILHLNNMTEFLYFNF
jgi:hypothetical protein